jgi:hypothetical protein
MEDWKANSVIVVYKILNEPVQIELPRDITKLTRVNRTAHSLRLQTQPA